MKKSLYVATLLWFLSVIAIAQTAVVSRSVNLRPDPSTDNAPLVTLAAGTQLQLLESAPTNTYLHVKTSDDTEGWVWSRNVHLQDVPITSASEHVGPARLYPEATITPGLADTLKVEDLTKRYTEHCPSGKTSCTYSQAHRDVPQAVHTHAYDEYNVPQSKRDIQNGEVDHFYPLCAGGSNDIQNLWYQPADNDWNGRDFGFHAKDKLETLICEQIKAGTMDPKDAFERIKTDWVKFFLGEGLNDQN